MIPTKLTTRLAANNRPTGRPCLSSSLVRSTKYITTPYARRASVGTSTRSRALDPGWTAIDAGVPPLSVFRPPMLLRRTEDPGGDNTPCPRRKGQLRRTFWTSSSRVCPFAMFAAPRIASYLLVPGGGVAGEAEAGWRAASGLGPDLPMGCRAAGTAGPPSLPPSLAPSFAAARKAKQPNAKGRREDVCIIAASRGFDTFPWTGRLPCLPCSTAPSAMWTLPRWSVRGAGTTHTPAALHSAGARGRTDWGGGV